MEDDFEYHITFPSVTHLEQPKEPVVILFGWAGCVDRHLSKYSDIYEKRGCTSIRYITSKNILSPKIIDEKKIYSLAEKVVSLLLDMKFEEHPIFFHVFSNGGAAVYRHVSYILRNKHKGIFQVKGCIFDSTPAKVSLAGIARATLAVTEGNSVQKYAMVVLVLVRVICLGIYNIISSFFSGQPQRYKMWNVLLEEPNMCPQLFLFSKADDVCNWESIQEFAEGRKMRGVKVTAILWDDSPHVQHMVVHREAYVNQVFSFIDQNLNRVEHQADNDKESGPSEENKC